MSLTTAPPALEAVAQRFARYCAVVARYGTATEEVDFSAFRRCGDLRGALRSL